MRLIPVGESTAIEPAAAIEDVYDSGLAPRCAIADSGETGSFVTLEPQTDADGVDEIVADQPGRDGERKLRRGGGQEWVG